MKLFLLLAVVASAVAALAGQARAATPAGCFPQSERLCLVADGAYQVAGTSKGSASCNFGKNVARSFYLINGCKPAAPVKKTAKPGLEVKKISVTFERP